MLSIIVTVNTVKKEVFEQKNCSLYFRISWLAGENGEAVLFFGFPTLVSSSQPARVRRASVHDGSLPHVSVHSHSALEPSMCLLCSLKGHSALDRVVWLYKLSRAA